MSAARFLRPRRRRAAYLRICLCLPPLVAYAGLQAETAQMAGGAETAMAESAARAAGSRPAVSPGLLPAPTVFEVAGTARWDGRRTLRRVWVSHPQTGVRRRVIDPTETIEDSQGDDVTGMPPIFPAYRMTGAIQARRPAGGTA